MGMAMARSSVRRPLTCLAAGVAALAGLGALAGGPKAQTARTIRIVVPFAAGGPTSVLARLLADQIGTTQRVTTVVENRPGAGGVVGTEAVARAAPDGNTLLINGPALLINPLLRKQSYDPFASFQPICTLVEAPAVLAVKSESPYATFSDLVAAARAQPGQLTFASVAATGAHIAFEEFKRSAHVDIAFVPYPGSAPMVTALLGGHVTSILDNFTTMSEHVNAGKLRALATFSPRRIEGLAQIPTFAEAGHSSYVGWWGLFGPARMSKETASELVGWTRDAMQMPETRQKLAPLGLYPSPLCGADFAAELRRLRDDFSRIIRETNIKVE
jgi:tripartite-type tricarboxylate transporter receptor subunit TctC